MPQISSHIVATAISIDPLYNPNGAWVRFSPWPFHGVMACPSILVGETQAIELPQRTPHREEIYFATGEDLDQRMLFDLQETQDLRDDHCPLAVRDYDKSIVSSRVSWIAPIGEVFEL